MLLIMGKAELKGINCDLMESVYIFKNIVITILYLSLQNGKNITKGNQGKINFTSPQIIVQLICVEGNVSYLLKLLGVMSWITSALHKH